MGVIFYLAGVVLAAYSGYSGLKWYFIFIASLLMATGYFFIRAPQIIGIVSQDGFTAIPKLLLIQFLVYSIISAPVYFIATIFNDETEKFESTSTYIDQVSKLCEAIGEEAQSAIAWRESGKSLDEAINKTSEYYKDNEFMKEYSIKIWRGVYENKETFKPENPKSLVVGICVTSMMEREAKSQNLDPLAYACMNQARVIRQLALYRDKGVSKSKLRSRLIESSEKGDPVLEALNYREEALEGALSAVDYVFSNAEKNSNQLYNSFLVKCVADVEKSESKN